MTFGLTFRLPRPNVGRHLGTPRDLLNVLEWFRLAADVTLVLGAKYLPLTPTLALADLVGWIDVLVPSAAGRTARLEMAAATGQRGFAGLRLAARRLAMPRKRLVYRWRFAGGRERLADWTVLETGTEELRELRAAGTPVLLALAHFTSGVSSFLETSLTEDRVSVKAGKTWRLSPFDLRRHIRSPRRSRPRASIVVRDQWTRGFDWNEAAARLPTQDEMVAQLARPAALVSIYVDTLWNKAGAYRRPFAGQSDRGFALGAARTARLAQCPVVPYLILLGTERRTAHIECGPAIAPPRPDDATSDRRVVDAALDWFEHAIARYPAQYPDSGHARRWNAAAGEWQAADQA